MRSILPSFHVIVPSPIQIFREQDHIIDKGATVVSCLKRVTKVTIDGELIQSECNFNVLPQHNFFLSIASFVVAVCTQGRSPYAVTAYFTLLMKSLYSQMISHEEFPLLGSSTPFVEYCLQISSSVPESHLGVAPSTVSYSLDLTATKVEKQDLALQRNNHNTDHVPVNDDSRSSTFSPSLTGSLAAQLMTFLYDKFIAAPICFDLSIVYTCFMDSKMVGRYQPFKQLQQLIFKCHTLHNYNMISRPFSFAVLNYFTMFISYMWLCISVHIISI